MTKKLLTEDDSLVYNEDTNKPGVSSPRRADVDQHSAEAKMYSLLESRSVTSGLPVPPKNPDYVTCWVPDDVSLYSDNASVRQMQGWSYATEEDFPDFVAYIAKDAVTSRAAEGKRLFRYRECVLMKLPVGAHKAWMTYFHEIKPKELEQQAMQEIKTKANNQIGARLEGDDPFGRPNVTKVSTYN